MQQPNPNTHYEGEVMRRKVILVTGASGEIGQALVKSLADQSDMPIKDILRQTLYF